MAVILAIDSSVGVSSVAIWQAGNIVSYLENKESSMQSARLMPLVEACLQAAKLPYSSLTHVAATVGPGSFTGIRIGLAAARGIAYAASIPCLGFTTLEVMHAAGAELCIINAGKGEVFYQYHGKEKTEPAIGYLPEILSNYPSATIASSVALPAGYQTPAITHPRADALARLAATNPDRAHEAVPFYIRPPDAKPMTGK